MKNGLIKCSTPHIGIIYRTFHYKTVNLLACTKTDTSWINT